MFAVTTKTPGAITPALLKRFREDFESNPAHRVAMNALTRSSITQIALNCKTLNNFDFVFSNEIEISGPPVDQERAGTCWLFADTNWMRTMVAKKLNLKTFDFSQNHHEFYDKLEKANWFLEKMIEYRDRDMLDRKLVALLKRPVSDGGDWIYTANCIAKYGLVPQSVMPDTFNLKNTRFMNERLEYKARQGAMMIRELNKKGKSVAEMRKAKEMIMTEIHRILVMFLGLPPQKFSWSYWDDGPQETGKKKGKKKGAKKGKKKFHRITNITPQAFTKKYLDLDPNDYITLLHLPVDGFEFNQPYYGEMFQNTIGSSDQIFLNVEMKELKNATIKAVKAGDPVLYSSEAGPGTDAKLGYYHHDLFDYEALFNMEFPMDKSQRITYFHEQCNHLQLFIGVDLVKNKPVKWKVENSWGKQFGKNGLFMMSDEWFENFVFTILVHKKYVPAGIRKHLKKTPKLIPMGAPFS